MGKLFLNIIWIVLLTVITQIGGVVYIIATLCYRKKTLKKWSAFIILYLLCTFGIVPYIAPLFGREKIKTNETVKIHTLFTSLANRNYVVPEVNEVLTHVSDKLTKKYPEVEIHCLDANFPFFNGFPLLPHLSHKDGKKLDISLVYEDKKGTLVNDKPSVSGYGVFVNPLNGEYDQISVCKTKGYWKYDFPKYLTLGTIHSGLNFSEKGTRTMLQYLTQESSISKIFIEPHLRDRMRISHPKIRYHGCRAVRHDDHIHIQVY
ncbi:hypothetical protein [uncultured Dokdonia sp.]|uniref:hypothetical protein n=1 Tax=uncultured Dokdonia sp. TaxID=575653 RepID=UPI00261D3EDE|nr:hypothetical protein [uncultured Dokdonia sp.]